MRLLFLLGPRLLLFFSAVFLACSSSFEWAPGNSGSHVSSCVLDWGAPVPWGGERLQASFRLARESTPKKAVCIPRQTTGLSLSSEYRAIRLHNFDFKESP